MQQTRRRLKAESGARSKGRGRETPRRSREELLTCLLTYFFKTTNLISLRTLCSLDDVELDLIAFFQALVTFALNGAVMDEDIGPALAAEESVAFCIVEPLYGAFILCQWTDSLFRV
jgi:hypothetical protein